MNYICLSAIGTAGSIPSNTAEAALSSAQPQAPTADTAAGHCPPQQQAAAAASCAVRRAALPDAQHATAASLASAADCLVPWAELLP